MRMSILPMALAGLMVTGGAALAQQPGIELLARTCNACHGVAGVSAGLSMPSIGGLPRDYLQRVMKQWKYGERSGITMPRIVKGLSDDEINALAAHFARQPWVPVPQPAVPERLAQGRAAVFKVCTDCHGMTGGDPDVDAPPLNGQWARYMELEVEKYLSPDFRMPHRRMKKAVTEPAPAEAAAAADYFGAQKK